MPEHKCELIKRDDGTYIVACQLCDWTTTITHEVYAEAVISAHRLLRWDWPYGPTYRPPHGWNP
jgi:hypothetical protein